MTTNKTIKRVGKLVAGLAVCGSTLFAVGGGCPGNFVSFGDGGAEVEGNPDSGDLDLKLMPNGKWVACCVSDRNIKTQFEGINKKELLAKLGSLPLSTWRYRSDPEQVRHIGPMAQDFRAAFGLGDSDRYIHIVDQGGVAIAAIQALQEEISERDGRIARLEARLEGLENAVSGQAAR